MKQISESVNGFGLPEEVSEGKKKKKIDHEKLLGDLVMAVEGRHEGEEGEGEAALDAKLAEVKEALNPEAEEKDGDEGAEVEELPEPEMGAEMNGDLDQV
jgi:hypothetical protein